MLVHVQLGFHQNPQVLFCKVAYTIVHGKSVFLGGFSLTGGGGEPLNKKLVFPSITLKGQKKKFGWNEND